MLATSSNTLILPEESLRNLVIISSELKTRKICVFV